MWSTLLALLRSVCSALKSRCHLALENLALPARASAPGGRSRKSRPALLSLAFAVLVGLARCIVLGSAKDPHPLASAGCQQC